MFDPITVTVVLDTTPRAAFDAFVDRFDAWWPKDPFSLGAGHLELEPGQGGRILEHVGADDHVWGHVTRWEPPGLIELAWYVGRAPDQATHVQVTFQPTDDGRTGLTLVQSNWEVLGDEAGPMRDRNHAGWTTILKDGFAPFVARTCPPPSQTGETG